MIDGRCNKRDTILRDAILRDVIKINIRIFYKIIEIKRN